jgi:AbrB family looped-hinge helix DNA binding protein
MEATIDRFGRILIPKSLREELDLEPGTVLELETFDGEIRLRAANRHKGLFVKEDVLVYGGTAVGDIDGALRSQRQKRLAKVGSAKG